MSDQYSRDALRQMRNRDRLKDIQRLCREGLTDGERFDWYADLEGRLVTELTRVEKKIDERVEMDRQHAIFNRRRKEFADQCRTNQPEAAT